jgi:hypothetical protein
LADYSTNLRLLQQISLAEVSSYHSALPSDPIRYGYKTFENCYTYAVHYPTLLVRNIAIAKNYDVLSTRHPGESRGPVPRAGGLKRLDSGVRRNDGIRPPRIRQDFWQLL